MLTTFSMDIDCSIYMIQTANDAMLISHAILYPRRRTGVCGWSCRSSVLHATREPRSEIVARLRTDILLKPFHME
jgi:hypothetical protein